MGALIVLVVLVVLLIVLPGIRIINQYERGVVLRLGKYSRTLEPGFRVIIPYIDKMTKVDVRTTPMDVPKQEVITRDNVTVNVDAVDINMVFFTLDRPAEQIAALPQRMLERGVKINGFTGNEGRFLTHYGLSRADIDQALDIFCECID